MKTYEVGIHYTDEAGDECEALATVGGWDEDRARVLALDWAVGHGIVAPVIAWVEAA